MVFFRSLFLLSLLSSCQSFVSGKTKPVFPDSLETIIRNHKATVLIWWGTQCPCVTRYQSRMEELQKNYASQSVAVIAVSSNADDSAEKATLVAKQRQLKIPLFFDNGGLLASKIGATTTPTAILLNSNGEVQFAGWMDNERMPGNKNRIAYLENAIIQLLKGEKIEVPKTPVYGCPITQSF